MCNIVGNNEKVMVSTQNGKVTTVLEIPDEVFSEKILGDGVAIIPTSNDIVSPVDGEIVQIAETGHAFCIKADDGVEILIHVGVDTVNLKGEGFKTCVKAGDKVKAGQIIGSADIDFIKDSGYPTYTAVLITNLGIIDKLDVNLGDAHIGDTAVLKYTLR